MGQSSTLTVASINGVSAVIQPGNHTVMLDNTGGGSVTVSPITTTTYTLTLTDANGATATDTAIVTVTPRPTATLTANPTTITSGQSTTLTVASTNAVSAVIQPGNYTVTLDNTGAGSRRISFLTTTTISLTYTLTVTDANGVTATDTATVTVTPRPTATLTANPTTITSGQSTTLTVASTNAVSAVVNPGNHTVTLDNTGAGSLNVSPTATTTYTLTVTDANGVRVEAKATVTVNNAPTADAGLDQTVREGATVTLDGSGSSDPEGETLSYAWTQTSGWTVTLSGAATASPSFTAPENLAADAVLVFSLTVTVTAGPNDAPTADAGDDQTVAEEASVTLDGSGSTDPEGEALAYAWTQTSGRKVTLSGAATVSPSFTAPTQLAADAVLVFLLIVSDGANLSQGDTVVVTVTAGPNDAPTADAGDDQTAAEGASVTLDGSGSDPEGEALSFAWTQTSGQTVTLSDATAASPSFTAPTQLAADAALVFSLTVTDARNAASTADTVVVTVTAGPNDAPTADAGDDQTVAEEASVTLDGSGSTDPEGETLSFAWTQTSGQTVTLSDATAASPSFTAPTELLQNAVLVFSLTVTDARNAASTADTVTVTVTAGPNDAPTADAGDDQTVSEGASVTLDGSGSADPEGEALAYAWTQTSGQTVTLSGAATASPSFTAPENLAADAVLVFSLTVTDARNAASTADTVTVTVTAGPNDAPTADAGDDQTVSEGASVTLDGSGSADPEGETLAYAWMQTSGQTVALSDATAASPCFTAPTELLQNAVLVFSLTVTDARNAASLPDTVTVTVTAGPNDAPTADGGDDQTVSEGASVTLDGSGSADPEGEALSYAWTQTSGQTVTLSGATTASPRFTAPENLAADAVLVFSLTVTDARNAASTADTVIVTVTAGSNDAPTADGGDDQTVSEGATVTLDGSGSSDPEGEALSYAWTQTSGQTVTLSGATTASPRFTAPPQLAADAALVFSLTVTDARNAASTADTVTVTVTAGPNDAPTANAGPDRTVAEEASVTLDGSGSTDPEGETLSYAWTQTSGQTVTLSGAATASPRFTAPTQLTENATLVFALTVTDARNAASTPDTVTVTVTPADPDPPGCPAVVQAQPGQLSFALPQDAEPAARTVVLRAADGEADFHIQPAQSWITAMPQSGSLAADGEAAVEVTVDPAGLEEGTRSGRLHIRSGGCVAARVRIMLEVLPPLGPAVSEHGVVNAAAMSAFGERTSPFVRRTLPPAPGSMVALLGKNFAAGGLIAAEGFPLPLRLGGVSVRFDGLEARLFAVTSQRIYAQLPSALAADVLLEGATSAIASVVVETAAGSSYPRRFFVGPHGPGIFTISGEGTGQGAVLLAGTTVLAAPPGFSGDIQLAQPGEMANLYTASRPARAGEIVEIYATGLGAVEPPIADGANSCEPQSVCAEDFSNAALRRTVERPRVWIGGVEIAEEDVLFSGLAPTLAAVNLVVARAPQGVEASDAVEVKIAVGGRESQPGVTIAVE